MFLIFHAVIDNPNKHLGSVHKLCQFLDLVGLCGGGTTLRGTGAPITYTALLHLPDKMFFLHDDKNLISHSKVLHCLADRFEAMRPAATCLSLCNEEQY